MKKILLSAAAFAVMTSSAFAEPAQLTDTQMDGVTAGIAHFDHGSWGHGKRYGKKGGKQINFANVHQSNVVLTPSTAVAIGHGGPAALAGATVRAANASFIGQGNF